MKISDAFPSNYLKAADLNGRTIPVTIADCQLEDLGGESKPVLRFVGKDKGCVLNKSNASVLADAFGDETSAWNGKKIELYSEKVFFQGRMVDGLRVRIPPQPAAVPAAEDFDDADIGF